MNEFCAESLIKLEFRPVLGFEYLKRPFENIEELTIYEFKENSLTQKKCLSKLFPKVRRLKFVIYHMENGFSSAISDYFPNMQHLELILGWEHESYTHYKQAILTALRMNSHLKSLKISIHSFSFLQEINDSLQSIESIGIELCSVELGNPIYFPNVKSFSTEFFVGTGTQMSKIPFLFGQLKKFTFDASLEHLYYNDNFNNFPYENPTIEKLTLDGKLEYCINPKKLQETLPSLNEICFTEKFYTINFILKSLINDLKSVKRISFLCSFRFTDDEVRMLRANDIWHIIQSEQRHKRFKYGIVAHMVTVERIK